MYTFLMVVHCILAVVITVVVLVQSGKGGGLGAGFGGGGANTLFGSSGGGNFFTKLTMWLAAGFMITSLGLTKVKNISLKTSIFDQGSAASAPVNAPKPVSPNFCETRRPSVSLNAPGGNGTTMRMGRFG